MYKRKLKCNIVMKIYRAPEKGGPDCIYCNVCIIIIIMCLLILSLIHKIDLKRLPGNMIHSSFGLVFEGQNHQT